MSPYVVIAVAAALALSGVGGYKAGESREHDRRVAEVATLHQTYSDAAASVARDNVANMQAAIQRGNTLTARLQASESTLNTTKKERDRALKNLTTGRLCLSRGAVRLLNAGAEGGGSASSLPGATGSTPAADGAFATDGDVAEWASACRTGYDTCRDRLDALIDWHEHEQAQGAAR